MVLYICQHDPFGTVGGGAMASHAYLRAFSDIAKGNIDLICAETIKYNHSILDPNIKLHNVFYVPERSRIERCLSIITGHLNRYITFVKKYLKQHHFDYNLIVFDHSSIAGPLVDIANKYGIKTITIHHNYEKEYFYDNSHGIYRLLFLHHVIKCEKRAYLQSMTNLFLTEQDMGKFKSAYGVTSARNEVLGTFEYKDYVRNPLIEKEDNQPITFAITGSLSPIQTQDAIKFFFEELYKYLPSKCRLIIAGRNPTNEIKDLCKEHPNVTLIANPSSMDTVIQQADIYLCATRLGGGLKLRVMDGLKLGLPVLVHSCSARGFDMFYQEDCFKIFSTPAEFSNSMDELISGVMNHKFKRSEIQEIYRKHFSYQSGSTRLHRIIGEI